MELFSNIPHKTQKDYIERELSEFREISDLHEIFKSAIDKIQEKIENVDDFSIETELAYQQLQEIKVLYELFQTQYMVNSFTQIGNIEIENSFRSILSLIDEDKDLSGTSELIHSMIDGELNRLADTFFVNTFRDKVESSIDFKGWGFHETYNETQEMTIFMDVFTAEYVSLLEEKGGEKLRFEDVGDEIELNQEELDKVLGETMSRIFDGKPENYTYFLQFNIGFTLAGEGEIERDLSLFGPIVPQVDVENTEIQESLPVTPEDDLVPEAIQEAPPQVEVSNKPNEISGEKDQNIEELISTIINETNQETPSSVLDAFNQGLYTHEQAMEILEGEEGFQIDKNIITDENGLKRGYSFGDALKDFGFSDSLQSDLNLILGKELNQTEIQSLINMTRYFLYIESSGGYNVSNYEGVSTAKGYFQYLTGDGGWLKQVRNIEGGDSALWITTDDWSNDDLVVNKGNIRVRKFWGNNSYETALQRLPEDIIDGNSVFQSEISKTGNQDIQNPRILSANEQVILFISDLRKRPGAEALLKQMLQGDISAVEDLYRIHHTDTDEDTEFRMLLAKREVYKIPIEVYTTEGN